MALVLTVLLALSAFGARAQTAEPDATAAPPVLPETMTEANVLAFIAEHGISTVEAFVEALPPLHKRHFVSVFDSASPSAAFISADSPRVVSWGADARFLVTWTTNARDPFYEAVEFLQPVPEEGRWIAGVIDFSADPPALRHPAACSSCHGKLNKPLWGAQTWLGTEFRSETGGSGFPDELARAAENLRVSTHPRLTPLELERYAHWAYPNRPPLVRNPRRIHFASRDTQVPNWEFGGVLSARHGEILFERLKARDDYHRIARTAVCGWVAHKTLRWFSPAEFDPVLLSGTLEAIQGNAAGKTDYRAGSGSVSVAVLFLMFHDLWRTDAGVKALYRSLSNEHVLSRNTLAEGLLASLLQYPRGTRTAEDELVAAYDQLFGLAGQQAIDARASKAVSPRYSHSFMQHHFSAFRGRVCGAMSGPAASASRHLEVAASPQAVVSADQVRLVWRPYGDFGFQVLRGLANEAGTLRPYATTSGIPEYRDTDVERGGVYVYRVRAIDPEGDLSLPSHYAIARIPYSARLHALSLSGIDLAFDSATERYAVDVVHEVVRTTVAATAARGGAALAIEPDDADPVAEGHQVELGVGETVISVRVTAADGTQKAYAVTVTRAAAPAADNTPPAVTIASGAAAPVTGPFEVAIAFSEPVTGFARADIAVGNGSATALAGTGSAYAATVTPAANVNGAVTVDVPAGVAFDAANNGNAAAAQFSIAAATTSRPGPALAGFTLFRANGADVGVIGNNEEIVLHDPAALFNIRANGAAGSGAIGSVSLELTGSNVLVHTRYDDIAPYTLYGDRSGAALPPGDYVVAATPYAAANRNGRAGAKLTAAFSVVAPSNDATLRALSLSGIDIGAFASGTTAYTVDVAHHVARTTVTATPTDSDASVVIGSIPGTRQTVTLAEGSNHVAVVVTAEDGRTAKTYTVTVTRAAAGSNVAIADFTLFRANGADVGIIDDNEKIVLADAAALFNIRADVAAGSGAIGSVRLELTGPDSLSYSRTENWAPYTLHGDDGGAPLPAGDYEVAATPYRETNLAGEAGAKLTVSFSVTAASAGAPSASSDATLSVLSLSGIDIGAFASATTAYAADVAHDVASTTVTARAHHSAAGVVIADASGSSASGQRTVSLAEGSNSIRVTVTAEDRTTTKTYTVTVTRAAASNDATLSALSLSGIDIGTFASGTTAYAADVAHDVASTTVTATLADGNATVAIGGVAGTQRTVTLAEGSNPITVAVTAEDGQTTKTYTVAVTRAAPGPNIAIAGFTLFRANGADIETIDDGGEIVLADPAALFNIRANVAAGSGAIGSVHLELTGPNGLSYARTEGLAPYALHGDRGGAALPPGAYVVAATPYTEKSRGGTAGARLAAAFSVAAPPSDDATLSGLGLSGIDIGAFASGTTAYAADVPHDVASTTVTATPTDGNAGVTIGGVAGTQRTVTLAEGSNPIAVAVTAEDGQTTKTYTVTVTRAASAGPNIAIAGFTLFHANGADIETIDDGGEIVLAEPAAQFNIRADVAAGSDAVGSVHLELTGPNGLSYARTEGIAPYALHGDKGGAPLPAGDYEIAATPYTEQELGGEAGAKLAVSFSVAAASAGTPPASSDASLSALSLSGVDIGMFATGTTAYSASVAHGVASTTVSATPNDGNATVAIGGVIGTQWTVALAEGSNGIAVAVTAEDGATTKTYTVTVTRAAPPSDDATLSGLSLSGVDIGAFASGTTAYAADVAHDVASTTVTATPNDGHATVAIGGGGGTQRTVALAVGANAIAVAVTAEDGATTKTYTVTVTRAAPPSDDATLSGLSLSGIDIGAFASGTTAYAADVAHDVASTTVSATPNDGNATVAIGGVAGTQRTVALAEGANAIAVAVTAEDGATTKTYTVTVTRAAAEGDGDEDESGGDLPAAFALDGKNDSPSGLWSDGATLWVADQVDGKLYAYRLADGTRQSSRDIRARGADTPMGLWSDGATVWVASFGGGAVLAYRLSDGARLASRDIDAGAAGNRQPAGIWSDGATLWAADWGEDKLFAYRLSDGAREASRDIALSPPEGNASPAGLWREGATLWVSDWLRGRVLAYAPDGSREASRDIDTGAAGDNYPTGLWSDGRALWVTDGGGGGLGVHALPGGSAVGAGGPGGVADGGKAVVAGVGRSSPPVLADGALRAGVAAALGKSAGAPITVGEMVSLSALNLRGAGVADLSGLERAANLAALDLAGNAVADLGPLARLGALRHLRLAGNPIADFSPLASLIALETLDLGATGLSDLYPLSVLTGLRALRADGNRIADLTPLSSLTALETLDLSANRIADLHPLSSLTALTRLRLGGNRITDLYPLSGLSSLMELALGGNAVADVQALSHLAELRRLDLRGNRVAEVYPLAAPPALIWLDLGGNRVADFSPLDGRAGRTVLGRDEQRVPE